MQPCHQPKRHGNVDHVDDGLHSQRGTRALPAQQRSQDHVVGQRRRGRPDSCVAVDARVPRHIGRGPEHCDGQRDERPSHSQNQNANCYRRQQRASEMQPQLLMVLCSISLRHQACGAHAQKAEGPEYGVEEDAAHGHAAERRRSRQMARENRVHCREQRLGQVGEDKRNRQQENPPVPVGHWVDCIGSDCKQRPQILLTAGQADSPSTPAAAPRPGLRFRVAAAPAAGSPAPAPAPRPSGPRSAFSLTS